MVLQVSVQNISYMLGHSLTMLFPFYLKRYLKCWHYKANGVAASQETSLAIPFYHEAKINKCALIYKRLNGDCPNITCVIYLSRTLIDIRTSRRITRKGSINLICPKYKREAEGRRTLQVSGTQFWISLKKKLYWNYYYY